MALEVMDRNRMLSDLTSHQARYVGDDKWEISCLPGRQLTCEQAVAALRAAEEVAGLLAWMRSRAQELSLTERELVQLVTAAECHWPRPTPPPRERGRRRRRWMSGWGASA